MKHFIMQYSLASCYFLPLSSKHSLTTLHWNTLNLWSSLSERDQISHSYKTSRITASYILILTFLDRIQKHKRFWTEWLPLNLISSQSLHGHNFDLLLSLSSNWIFPYLLGFIKLCLNHNSALPSGDETLNTYSVSSAFTLKPTYFRFPN